MRAGVVNGGIPGAVATGPSGGSRSRPDFPSSSLCHVCRLRLTLPHQNLRDKMRPLEVVRSRRGARVDESTCLESMRLGNGTVGSNPTLSAIEQSPARLRRRVSWNCHRERTRWDSNEGDRGGDTPLRGETRGGGPPQWERVSATSNAHPLRHQRLLDHRLANRGDGIDIVTVTGPGPVQQNPVNPARSGRKQR